MSNFTKNFLENLNASSQVELAFCGLAKAQELALSAKTSGYLALDDDFGEKLMDRALFGNQHKSVALGHFYGNYSRAVSMSFMERLFFRRIDTFIKKHMHWSNGTRPLYDLIEISPFDGGPRGDVEFRILRKTIPSSLTYYCFQFGQVWTLLGFLFDQIFGFPDRQRAMGIKPWHIIATHFVRANLFFVPMFIGISTLVLLFSKIEIDIFALRFLVVLIVLSICGNSTGIFLGAISPSIALQTMIIFAYQTSLCAINSMFWPNESLPYFMKPVTYIYPYDKLQIISVDLFAKKDIFLTVSLFTEQFIWIVLAIAYSLWKLN